MSLRAIIETVVHVEKFRNIDFFNQGLYFFRITLYNEKGEERYFARPYQIVESGGKTGEDKKFIISPGRINEDLSSFCTSTILVRYSEQEINLNEYCIFRTEIDVDEDYLDTIFYMDVELMFTDLKDLDQTPQMIKEHTENIQNEVTFECSHMIHYKISRMAYGMSEFIPIITDKHFYAITGCTIHSTLIDYRFRVAPNSQNQTFGSRLLYLQSGIKVKNKKEKAKRGKKNKIPKEIGADDSFPENYNHWVPKSAAEFLFCDESGEMATKIDPEVADYLYNEYTNIIKGLFKKLAKTYNSFIKNVVKDKKILKDKLIPEVAPKLIPPGYHVKLEKLKKRMDLQTNIKGINFEETKSSTVSIENEESKISMAESEPPIRSSNNQENKNFEEEKKEFEEEKKEYEEEII